MKIKKWLSLALCVVVTASVAVMGTLAYLTDSATVENTFTVGKVNITVDEEKVTPDGEPTPEDDARVTGNQYHLIPGQSYTKDPTMTVKADSEESYVRMLLTLNCKSQLDTIFAPGIELTDIFKGYDAEKWAFVDETADTDANTVTYEFRYPTTVAPEDSDVVLEPLFTSFELPSRLDGDDLASIQALKITVVGHAIQASGFENADQAWEAFDAQS